MKNCCIVMFFFFLLPFSAQAATNLTDKLSVNDNVSTFDSKLKRFRGSAKKVALLFVGHGEPVNVENGDIPITLADGTPFGPHGVSLGVPEPFQYTEWAAAYEEISTAMSYIFGDYNGNGVDHELMIFPVGDVPPFFNWDAFHSSIYEHYAECNNYSPHNDALIEHIKSLDVKVEGAQIDTYLAFLDAVPRIRDVVFQIAETDTYDELVVVPLLISDSTHTQEVDELVEESLYLMGDIEVLVTEPFFEIPFMRKRMRDSILSMMQYVVKAIPRFVSDQKIGVVLASHGTPYLPPYEEFGWQEGDIFSHLILAEDDFHDEIGSRIPWKYKTGRMKYSTPTIEDALTAFEEEGIVHVMVIPSAFPTAAIHTMLDVASAAVNRAVLPAEGIVKHTRPSGMKVYYTSKGFADIVLGRFQFRRGLNFIAETGVREALLEGPEKEL